MATDYTELHRRLSRRLAEDAREAGIFDHPTAKGDARENLINGLLSERVGTSFGVSKAEVVDSRGQTTGEFDCAIFDQSVGASLHLKAGRRVIRVETLAAVVEIKSRLDGSDVDDYTNNCKGLDGLQRYFRPAPMMGLLKNFLPEKVREEADAMFRDGLPAPVSHQDIPAIVHAFFAFDGPDAPETAAQYMAAPGIDIICVLGKYTIARARLGASLNMGAPSVRARGDDALGGFLALVEEVLYRMVAVRAFVLPDTARYVTPA